MSNDVHKKFDSKVLFGGEVQYFRLEPKAWRPILKELKKSGLETVSSYVPWDVHEIEPPSKGCRQGRYDFEGRTAPHRNLIGYLSLVHELGLKANVRPGPFCCAEMAWGGYPRRMVMEEPGMMVWDRQNRTQQGLLDKPPGRIPAELFASGLS